jgi:predicted RecB family nuclease
MIFATDDILSAYLKCPHKAFQKLKGAAGKPSEYELLQAKVKAEYTREAGRKLSEAFGKAVILKNPHSQSEALRSSKELILNVLMQGREISCRFDAVVRSAKAKGISRLPYIPILFTPHERIKTHDRLRLAFSALVLADAQRIQPEVGKVIYGPSFKASRINLFKYFPRVRAVVANLQAIRQSETTPTPILNRHCPECEFRESCHAHAVEKDDLSLLRGLDAKQIANRRKSEMPLWADGVT